MTHTLVPLQTLVLSNFRGVRHTVIDLDPEVTLFFGTNAAGKTTILNAAAIALGAITQRVPRATGRDFAKRGDIRTPWRTRADLDEKVGVERPYTRVAVTTYSGLRWDVTRLRSAQDRGAVPPAVGMRGLNEILDPIIVEAQENPGKKTTPIPLVAAYGTERSVVDVPLRDRDFKQDFHRFDGLDHSLHATTRFKRVFEWFRMMEDEERRQREQRKDFDYKLPELEWVRRAVGRAELRCAKPRVETKPIRMLVDFVHDDKSEEPLDVSALSDGYRTHFSLVVDIARRMVQLNPSDDLDDPVRGTNTQAVILIDEIDLHLDPPWQARVVKGLRAAFPRAQFILTTHSEQVIGSVEARCARRLVWRDGEIAIEQVPFAQGATGERILIDLMNAPERVDGRITRALQRYLDLVSKGEGLGEEALKLRSELEESLRGDAALHRADLEMQRRDFMGKLGGTAR